MTTRKLIIPALAAMMLLTISFIADERVDCETKQSSAAFEKDSRRTRAMKNCNWRKVGKGVISLTFFHRNIRS